MIFFESPFSGGFPANPAILPWFFSSRASAAGEKRRAVDPLRPEDLSMGGSMADD